MDIPPTVKDRGALIIEKDGSIRCCPSNRYKMGHWASLKAVHTYRDAVFDSTSEVFEEVKESLRTLLYFILFVVLSPVLPMIYCYQEHRQAIYDIENQYAYDEDI